MTLISAKVGGKQANRESADIQRILVPGHSGREVGESAQMIDHLPQLGIAIERARLLPRGTGMLLAVATGVLYFST